MANNSSILAWKTPWTEEPGELMSLGSQRIGHDLATKAILPFIIKSKFFSKFSTWKIYIKSLVSELRVQLKHK